MVSAVEHNERVLYLLLSVSGGMYGGMMGQPSLQYGVGGEAKQTIDVQKSVVGKIIGKGGETITLIQRKSGAKVTVDQSVPEGQPCKVSLGVNGNEMK